MALEDAGRHRLDGLPVAHVTDLDLAPELVGERAESILPPRDEDAVPALLAEQARDRLAEPGGRARHDGDPAARGGRISGGRGAHLGAP